MHQLRSARLLLAGFACAALFAAGCGSTGTVDPADTRPATTPDSPATATQPEPAPTPSEDTDPRFATCAEANEAGHGPYRRDEDPEYGWYEDRDGDGTVCETG